MFGPHAEGYILPISRLSLCYPCESSKKLHYPHFIDGEAKAQIGHTLNFQKLFTCFGYLNILLPSLGPGLGGTENLQLTLTLAGLTPAEHL